MYTNTQLLTKLHTGDIAAVYGDIERMLEQNVMEEIAKQGGATQKDITIVKRMSKSSGVCNGVYIPYTDGERQYYGFTNGFCGIMDSENSYGFERVSERGEDLFQHALPVDLMNHKDGLEIPVDTKKLKYIIKIKKNKDAYNKVYFKIIDNDEILIVACNAKFLNDVLDFCKADKIYVAKDKFVAKKCGNAEYKYYSSAIVTESKDKKRRGFVLPLLVREDATAVLNTEQSEDMMVVEI